MGKDRECGRVFLVYLPSLDEITSVKLSGVMQPLRLMTVSANTLHTVQTLIYRNSGN